MENIRPSVDIYVINGRLSTRRTVSSNANVNLSANAAISECDDDVILIEREIPTIDLCTPDVTRQPRKPLFSDVKNGEYCEQTTNSNSSKRKRCVVDPTGSVDDFFDRLQRKASGTTAKTSTNSSIAPYASQNPPMMCVDPTGSVDNFFDRLQRKSSGYTAKTSTNSSIAPNASQNPPVMCVICLRSAIGRKPLATHCGHVFCEYCIKRSMLARNRCPTCKGIICSADLRPLYI